ncbi:hypothetical protein [Cellulosimicrobium arenosum]|uniref:S1 motif domain-containing protein n=1 Tax=Cellulosimicrobium arenosum TaxID=2708133 RepID=A0A927J129_9MICO|nr:hypothetical protein [Cellulosimicrobium arenosum]MBD8079944.1 hypothetical protein [Cellulosimicrobium arenosum]
MPKRNRAREAARAQGSPSAAPTAGERARTSPPRGVGHVVTEDAARELAERLLTPGRTWPVVVVTTPAGVGSPYVDPAALEHEVAGLAEVVVLPTGGPSWAFSDAMPDRTQVYGGASRVYAVEHDWVEHPHRSRLHFAWSGDDDERVRRHLVQDALGAAVRAGLVGRSVSPSSARGAGSVSGVVGGRAFVTLDDGGQAVVAAELTLPGVPLERILATGQRVEGTLDRASARLDVRASLPDAAGSRRLVHAAYQPGDVVLARVREVEHDAVVVDLLPELHCRVARDRVTGNELDDLADLFSEGEVVIARAVASPGGIAVRLDDVDESEDEPVAAPALLAGGPPWLAPPSAPEPSGTRPATRKSADGDTGPGQAEADPGTAAGAPMTVPASLPALAPVSAPVPAARRPAAPTPALLAAKARGEVEALPCPPEPKAPAPPPAPRGSALGDTQLALAAARAQGEIDRAAARDATRRAADLDVEVSQLRALVQEQREQVERRDRTIAAQKTRYRATDLKRQKATRQHVDHEAGDRGAPAEFADPVDQLRHDVYLAWARLVPAGEKADRPLGAYEVGPRFVESLGLEGVSRRKVVEALVHVLTGRASEINGYQLHRLRTSTSGAAPAATRDDGAVCWRLSVQVNTASARRLHFWRLADGSVELSRVVLHDDMEP